MWPEHTASVPRVLCSQVPILPRVPLGDQLRVVCDGFALGFVGHAVALERGDFRELGIAPTKWFTLDGNTA